MASKVELELVALTRKAGGDINKFASGASTAMKALGVVAAGALAVFASKKVLGAIGDVTDAAAKQEVAVNKLNSALRLAGDFSNEASRDLQNFASDLQSITTIGDETTLEMLALAKSFGVSNDGAKELVTAAADLAEVTGMSLDSAVRNLGKTYGGLTGELGEVIPALKELTTEQLKSGEAISFVTQRFGGAATAATNTYSGAMKQLSNAFGDFQETLGQIITDNPVVITLIQSLKSAFEDLGAFVTANQDGVRGFINDGIRAMMDLVPHAVRILGGLGKGFISMSRAILGATRNSIEFFNFLLDGSDDVADALKLIANPINAIVLGMTAVKEVMLGEAISKQEQEAKKLNLQLFQLRKHYEAGRISQEQFHDSARDVRDRMIENNEEINKLNGELDTLQKVGELVSIEIEADTAKFQEQIKKATETAIKGEELLVKAELGLSEATEALASRMEGLASDLRAAPNSKGTGTGGAASAQGDSPWFDKFSNFISENTPAWVSEIGASFSKFGDAVSAATPGWVKEMGGSILGSIGKNIGGGVKGGQAVVGDTIGAGITAMGIPGGELIGGLATQLAGATKEEAEQMAKDFAKGITEGVIALAENAPIFVEALAENAGPIITALISAIPKVAIALASSMDVVAASLLQQLGAGIGYQLEKLGGAFSRLGSGFSEGFNNATQALVEGVTNFPEAFGEQLPKAVDKFATAIGDAFNKAFESGGDLIKGIGDGFAEAAKTFVSTLVEKAQSFIDAITPGGKGGASKSGFVPFSNKPTATNPLGFATGGFVEGFGTKDTVPAMLTPGELVIDRTTGPRLNRFLDSAEAGGGGANAELLSRILALLERPQTVQTEVRLNERVLADIILQLNKSNARLTA